MRSIIFTLLFIGFTIDIQAQVNQKSKEVVQSFFTNFGNGDLEGVIGIFSETIKIISINEKGIEGANLYGTFNGKEGVRTFLEILSKTFETKSFSVDYVIGEDNIAFAKGSFIHKVKSTGKLFESDWALMCLVKNGKIEEYHFFEDSASFIIANQ